MKVNLIQKRIHSIAVSKGWWDYERNRGELLALVHSEVSEALEALRDGDLDGYHRELVDVVIRVLDILGSDDIDTELLLAEKCAINEQRPTKHGKQF